VPALLCFLDEIESHLRRKVEQKQTLFDFLLPMVHKKTATWQFQNSGMHRIEAKGVTLQSMSAMPYFNERHFAHGESILCTV
jgi:hypothetical protein